MLRPELLALPALTLLVFFGDYWININGNLRLKKEKALREASWWGTAFFIYGVLDHLLCSSSLFQAA